MKSTHHFGIIIITCMLILPCLASSEETTGSYPGTDSGLDFYSTASWGTDEYEQLYSLFGMEFDRRSHKENPSLIATGTKVTISNGDLTLTSKATQYITEFDMKGGTARIEPDFSGRLSLSDGTEKVLMMGEDRILVDGTGEIEIKDGKIVSFKSSSAKEFYVSGLHIDEGKDIDYDSSSKMFKAKTTGPFTYDGSGVSYSVGGSEGLIFSFEDTQFSSDTLDDLKVSTDSHILSLDDAKGFLYDHSSIRSDEIRGLLISDQEGRHDKLNINFAEDFDYSFDDLLIEAKSIVMDSQSAFESESKVKIYLSKGQKDVMGEEVIYSNLGLDIDSTEKISRFSGQIRITGEPGSNEIYIVPNKDYHKISYKKDPKGEYLLDRQGDKIEEYGFEGEYEKDGILVQFSGEAPLAISDLEIKGSVPQEGGITLDGKDVNIEKIGDSLVIITAKETLNLNVGELSDKGSVVIREGDNQLISTKGRALMAFGNPSEISSKIKVANREENAELHDYTLIGGVVSRDQEQKGKLKYIPDEYLSKDLSLFITDAIFSWAYSEANNKYVLAEWGAKGDTIYGHSENPMGIGKLKANEYFKNYRNQEGVLRAYDCIGFVQGALNEVVKEEGEESYYKAYTFAKIFERLEEHNFKATLYKMDSQNMDRIDKSTELYDMVKAGKFEVKSFDRKDNMVEAISYEPAGSLIQKYNDGGNDEHALIKGPGTQTIEAHVKQFAVSVDSNSLSRDGYFLVLSPRQYYTNYHDLDFLADNFDKFAVGEIEKVK